MVNYEYIINEKSFQKTKIFILVILYVAVFKIVYFTGGTKNVYPHLIYIPILMFSLLFGLNGGILGGIVGGLVLAVIPMDTATNEAQTVINFTMRMYFLTFLDFSQVMFLKISKVSIKNWRRLQIMIL